MYPEKVYAAWTKEKEIHQSSSSGGIFSVLANEIVKEEGKVCGVVMEMPSLELYHVVSSSSEDIQRMRGSKYFQVTKNVVYAEIKECLLDGKKVLYSGTACQVAALLSYLKGIDTSQLYTVDVLCHGVTSRKVIQKYLEAKEKKYASKAKKLVFRSKDKNLHGTNVKIEFENNKIYYGNMSNDSFKQAFNEAINLRISCYHCKYATEKRVADFTIADFWGLGEDIPFEVKTDGGVSVVLANTEKGRSFLTRIENSCEFYERTYEEAKKKNQCFNAPYPYSTLREQFFEKIDDEDFDKLVSSLLKHILKKNSNLKQRIKNIIKNRILKR